jgi:hypothetical protein
MSYENVRRSGGESKVVPVMFGADLILAAQVENEVFVAVKPLAENMGLKWSGQHDRITRDPILSEGIRMMRMPMAGHGQEAVCLRLDLLNGWLFGIDENRVKPEVKDRVVLYKRECYRVLFEHFFAKAAATLEATVIPPGEPRDEVRDITSNRQLVTEARQTWGAKAAQQMWLKLNLPTVPAMFEPQKQLDLLYPAEA